MYNLFLFLLNESATSGSNYVDLDSISLYYNLVGIGEIYVVSVMFLISFFSNAMESFLVMFLSSMDMLINISKSLTTLTINVSCLNDVLLIAFLSMTLTGMVIRHMFHTQNFRYQLSSDQRRRVPINLKSKVVTRNNITGVFIYDTNSRGGHNLRLLLHMPRNRYRIVQGIPYFCEINGIFYYGAFLTNYTLNSTFPFNYTERHYIRGTPYNGLVRTASNGGVWIRCDEYYYRRAQRRWGVYSNGNTISTRGRRFNLEILVLL